MILSSLKDAKDYLGIHPRLDSALNLLTPDFLNAAGTETRYLEGDSLYVTRFDYETVSRAESVFESHERYLDIHVMVRGCEYVDIARPETLTETEHRGDLWLYGGKQEQTVLLKQGDFLIVFPGDAHRLKIADGVPKQVSKVVFKVLFREGK